MTGFPVLIILGGLLYLSIRQSSQYESSDDAAHLENAINEIDSLLPQTQCGKCDYPGCRPYAEAVATGRAEINQCPPGGELTMLAMARLLGREPLPLPEHKLQTGPARVALIDEDLCIGCVKCIKACPVDAIIGAPKQMHTVIKQNCTGCELCVAPCPVDCISMEPVRVKTKEWVWSKPDPALRLRG